MHRRDFHALADVEYDVLVVGGGIHGLATALAAAQRGLRAAFALDAWLGRDRNEGVEPELHLPPARLVSRAATLKLFPGIRQQGLTGGANWYDYQIVYSNRLSLAVAEGAAAHGAILVNHAAALAAITDRGRITGMRVR